MSSETETVPSVEELKGLIMSISHLTRLALGPPSNGGRWAELGEAHQRLLDFVTRLHAAAVHAPKLAALLRDRVCARSTCLGCATDQEALAAYEQAMEVGK